MPSSLSACLGCISSFVTTAALYSRASTRWGHTSGQPAEKDKQVRNRRRGPRFYAHLPSAISLIDGKVQVGKVSYSQPSRGHCETISKFGMGLSLVGTRFAEAELSQIGRLLFVRIDLPEGPIEAVVTIVSSERAGEDAKKKWLLGVTIHQMSDEDRQRLSRLP